MIEVTLVIVGTEMLRGARVDTNSGAITRMLTPRGFRCTQTMIVADDIDEIAAAVLAGLSASDAVILSGGLGPTHDDVTGEGLAAAMIDPSAAEAIPSPLGGVDGIFWSGQGKAVAALPGVPRELLSMLPRLSERLEELFSEGLVVPEQAVIKVSGLAETEVASLIPSEMLGAGLEATILAGPGVVSLDFTCWDSDRRSEMLDIVKSVRASLGKHVYADDADTTLSQVVGEALLKVNAGLAVAESCTGGRIAAEITATAGSSRYFKGGVVAYENAVKVDLLGVDPALIAAKGAVDALVADQMARGVRSSFGAEVGLSTTGIAGPEGGTPDKPVGLVYVGLSYGDRASVAELRLRGGRNHIMETAANLALHHLRLLLGGDGAIS